MEFPQTKPSVLIDLLFAHAQHRQPSILPQTEKAAPPTNRRPFKQVAVHRITDAAYINVSFTHREKKKVRAQKVKVL